MDFSPYLARFGSANSLYISRTTQGHKDLYQAICENNHNGDDASAQTLTNSSINEEVSGMSNTLTGATANSNLHSRQ